MTKLEIFYFHNQNTPAPDTQKTVTKLTETQLQNQNTKFETTFNLHTEYVKTFHSERDPKSRVEL